MSEGQHKTGASYLPNFDGWRAIAVGLVIVNHTSYWLNPTGRGTKSLFLFLARGAYGVQLFFAISGYLITSRLLDDVNHSGRINYKAFYLRRAFRILPPVFLFLGTLALLKQFGFVEATNRDFVASLLFYRNFLTSGSWFTQHFWSLAVEEQFYFVWPLTIAFLFVPYRTPHKLITLGLALALWSEWGTKGIDLGAIHYKLLNGYRTDVQFSGLIFGGVAAIMRNDKRYDAFFKGISERWVLFACASAMAISTWARFPFGGLVFATLAPILILTRISRPDTKWHHFLEQPWIRWVGQRSFGIYVWQQLFMGGAAPILGSYVLSYLIRIALILLVTALTYRFIEKPLVGLGHRLARATRDPVSSKLPIKRAA